MSYLSYITVYIDPFMSCHPRFLPPASLTPTLFLPDCTFIIINLYLVLIKSRRMRWAGHVARVGKRRGVYRVLVGKPEGKRPLGRPRRRWEDNIKI